MIRVSDNLTIDERRITEFFARADGPGGQNVNKVSSAVQLRYDFGGDESLPDAVKKRLRRLAGHLVVADDALIVAARRYRSQARNRQDAHTRLLELLRRAAIAPKRRIATRPTQSSKNKRLTGKRFRGGVKKSRRERSFE